ncbi:unnamed protein product [Protopolystoma xenopodis]|uniref:Uncharacterized protein n=1 Tax=Protopolystoma xenopodis TaxID=117903 RepID=A0A3S5BN58_9PLAT|nr:unnamed protein product [Protopolystoma xenopodis]
MPKSMGFSSLPVFRSRIQICIAISNKELVREGDLRILTPPEGLTSVLKKLGRKRHNSVYLILFNDLLLVTRRKK